MESPAIHLAQVADLPAIVACVRTAYAKYLLRMDREPAPLHADYAALIANGSVYILELAGTVCGLLVMMPRTDHLFIENIALDPTLQGQGYGRLLMAFAEQQARSAHLPTIRLYTNEVMTENLAFYTRLDFTEETRRIEDGYSRIFLRKDLSPA